MGRIDSQLDYCNCSIQPRLKGNWKCQRMWNIFKMNTWPTSNTFYNSDQPFSIEPHTSSSPNFETIGIKSTLLNQESRCNDKTLDIQVTIVEFTNVRFNGKPFEAIEAGTCLMRSQGVLPLQTPTDFAWLINSPSPKFQQDLKCKSLNWKNYCSLNE